MELDKFSRQLRLLELLTVNRLLSVEEIGKKLDLSRRTVYRYIDTFKDMGFIVKKEGTKYHIGSESPFFEHLSRQISFSEDEGLTLCQILNSVYNNSAQVRHLREKLANLYDSKILAGHGIDSKVAQNISTLFRAIREERVCLIRNYHSPSSGVVSDRVVEPYLFQNENGEVRCYEMSSQMNKTFKVNRMEEVTLLDIFWTHKEEHKPYYSDLFHFSGETRYHVKLALGNLATSILLEEYPDAERELSLADDGRHILETDVCNFRGVSRFILGLYDDIEVLESAELKKYLSGRIADMMHKNG